MDELSSEFVNTEIVCTLAAIGYIEEDNYYKGEDCLECLKDLIRFLRNDDATCDIRRQLGHSKVVEKDLIPILKSCAENEQEILEVCFRLLVNLTQPAMLCFGGKIPTEKIESNHYLEILSHLQSYKQAFAGKEIMAVIGRELGRRLQMEWDSRREEDTLVIERILLLIRNILHVPADPQAEKRTDEDATVHDQVLWNFHANGVDDLILYIASSPDESRWCMHALEIISHMLREQKPDVLAKTAMQRSNQEKDEDTRELEILYERERARKSTTARNGLRHSNFGGTFCIQNLKALNDENQLLYHRPVQNAKKLSFDLDKTARRKRKKEVHAKDPDIERKSTLSVRIFLKEFCSEFLENCYNPLMHIVKDNLKHSRAQPNDESYFLWAMRFFMEFNRKNKFEIAYISETMNVSTFQYMLILQTNFFDSLVMEKDDKVVWARRLHLALRAYQELIQHIFAMESFEDEAIKDSAKVIKENVFYVSEYREIFMNMLRKFDPCCQTRSFLRDVIEAFHTFLKLLEAHCKRKGRIVIQQKKRKAKKKKKTPRRPPVAPPLTAEQKEERWQANSAGLSTVLQSEDDIVANVTNPFDPISDVPEDEQRTKCLANIQRCIREELFAEAVVLLRTARQVWPSNSFGENDVDAEGEFMCFFDIFRMDLPAVANDINDDVNDEQEEVEISDPEEEELEAIEVNEKEFDISDFLKKLAHPTLLQPYCWLLDWYQENNSQTNHYIIKMLHRVAVDLKTPAMLFQLSLFATFRKIMSDAAASRYKELVTFSKYIVSKFFALLPNNPTLCTEILFWKSPSECYEITEGYGSLEQRNARQSGHSWTFEEEEELRRLYEEFKDTEELVESILSGITNRFRSRRQVVGKLISLGLVEDREILKKKRVDKNAWPEEEENELRTLFEEFRDSADIVASIIPNLSNSDRTRRQVVNKLVSIGLVEDREVLKKKHVNKNAWSEEEENELRNLFEEYKDSEDVVDSIISNLNNQSRTRRQVIHQLVKLNIVEDRTILRKKRSKNSKRKKNRDEYEEENSENGEGYNSDGNSSDEENDEESDEIQDDGEDTLTSLVAELRNSEYTEQLDWIITRLRSAAEDRDEDGDWEPLPLVTLTEESELALRDKTFQKMLKKIGLKPPSSEQERFWRIPETFSPNGLRKAATDLEMELESPASVEREKSSNPKRQKLAELAAAARNSSHRRDERVRKRKNRIQERPKDRAGRAQELRRSIPNMDDSDSDRENANDVPGDQQFNEEEKDRSSTKPKRKRIRMESDESEEEEDVLRTGELISDDEVATNTEKTVGEVSLAETEKQDGRQAEGSESSDDDDEDAFDLPVIRTKKAARHAVLDDDEDD